MNARGILHLPFGGVVDGPPMASGEELDVRNRVLGGFAQDLLLIRGRQ